MTTKTKVALLSAAVVSMITVGCGIVVDSPPLHIFGWVLVFGGLSFVVDMGS